MLVIHLSVSLVQTSSHRGPYRYFTRLASTKVHLTDVSMLCHTFVSSQIARTSTQAYIATYLRCLGMYVPRHVLTDIASHVASQIAKPRHLRSSIILSFSWST
jgi:hypothetical protein